MHLQLARRVSRRDSLVGERLARVDAGDVVREQRGEPAAARAGRRALEQ